MSRPSERPRRLSVSLGETTHAHLERLAKRYGVSLSLVTSRLLEQAVEDAEAGKLDLWRRRD